MQIHVLISVVDGFGAILETMNLVCQDGKSQYLDKDGVLWNEVLYPSMSGWKVFLAEMEGLFLRFSNVVSVNLVSPPGYEADDWIESVCKGTLNIQIRTVGY